MSKLMNITLVALVALLFCAYIEARPSPIKSYIDDIIIEYQNGSLRCDRVFCNSTSRCLIERFNSIAPSILLTTNQCYSADQKYEPEYSYAQAMFIVKDIDIEIRAFIGAVTQVTYGFSNSSQTVQGTVDAANWAGVQQDMTDMVLQTLENL